MPCPHMAREASMLGIDVAQQEIGSHHLPLGSRATGLHNFQDLSSAFFIRWGWKALSTASGALTQHLAWVWAKQLWGWQNLF